MKVLTKKQREKYQNKILIPYFATIVDKCIISILYDIDGTVLITTDLAQKTVPVSRSFELCSNTVTQIHDYAYTHRAVINYVDLLQDGDTFSPYLITLLPVYHPQGDIVALQSYAVESKFLGFQEQLLELLGNAPKASNHNSEDLTNREREVLFLLTYGATQDEIAQILQVSRGTIGNIISNQLCAKFGISGSNTKKLTSAAINAGIHQKIPHSLIRPSIIILNNDFNLTP